MFFNFIFEVLSNRSWVFLGHSCKHCSMPMHFYKKTVQNALAILVQVKFHDGKVDTFRKELLVV